MRMLTGSCGRGEFGGVKPSIERMIGVEGKMGARRDLEVHPAALESPEDRYKDMAQIPLA